jgi:hypothetical protein
MRFCHASGRGLMEIEHFEQSVVDGQIHFYFFKYHLAEENRKRKDKAVHHGLSGRNGS